MLQIELAQSRHILRPLPQGRNMYLHHIEPVIQVLPEGPLVDLLLQLPVGGGGYPHIDLNVPQASYPLETPVLQKGQQLGLHEQGHFADLVQKDGPAVGQLHQALFGLARPGKGPLFVAKKLRFQQIFRDCPAVNFNQGLVPPGALVVDTVDHYFFAGARLPANQQVHVVVLRQYLDVLLDALEGGADPDELPGGPAHEGHGPAAGKLFHAPADNQVDLVQVKGFLDVVAHPQLHGLHRLGHRAVSGH